MRRRLPAIAAASHMLAIYASPAILHAAEPSRAPNHRVLVWLSGRITERAGQPIGDARVSVTELERA